MPEISIFSLFLCLIPCLGVAWVAYRWSGRGREMIFATGRMLIQLLLIGFALVFLLETTNPTVGFLVVLVMIAVSAIISIRLVTEDRRGAAIKAVIALGLAGGFVLVFVLFVVLRLNDPWYQPRFMIPIAGMVFSNAMTAITLAAERFQNSRSEGQSYEAARSAAWVAALIPQINALLAVGLVSLPGMMTGQILSGVDPLIAVRYQIVVMAMLLQASGFAVAIFLWLSRPRREF